MTALSPATDPLDIPEGASIRRPDPLAPFVATSNRHRWGQCALSAVLPQLRTPSGPQAEEGTEAHKAAEYALLRHFAPQVAPDTPPVISPPEGLDDFDYSPAGVEAWRKQAWEYAQTYATSAAGLFSDCKSPTACLVEYKIENVTIRGVRVYTVADVVLWNSEARRLVVGDYKFGRGPVGVGTIADPNEQCAGAAVLRTMERETMGVSPPRQHGLFVYQPRTYYGEPWQVLAPMDSEWLAEQARKLDEELAAVAHAASELAAGRLVDPSPGDHCKYCPSARWCPAAAAFGTAALDVEAGRKTVVDLTPEAVMALWASRNAFKAFSEDLSERVRILYEQRHPAVVRLSRKGPRMWANESMTVEALMLADRFDLLRPAGIERAEAALPAATLDALTKRAPDILIYKSAHGAQPDVASEAFAKYLVKGGDDA